PAALARRRQSAGRRAAAAARAAAQVTIAPVAGGGAPATFGFGGGSGGGCRGRVGVPLLGGRGVRPRRSVAARGAGAGWWERCAGGVSPLGHPEVDRAQLAANDARLDAVLHSDCIRAQRGLSALREAAGWRK